MMYVLHLCCFRHAGPRRIGLVHGVVRYKGARYTKRRVVGGQACALGRGTGSQRLLLPSSFEEQPVTFVYFGRALRTSTRPLESFLTVYRSLSNSHGVTVSTFP